MMEAGTALTAKVCTEQRMRAAASAAHLLQALIELFSLSWQSVS